MNFVFNCCVILQILFRMISSSQVPGIPDEVYSQLRTAKSRQDLRKFGIISASPPSISTAGWTRNAYKSDSRSMSIVSDDVSSVSGGPPLNSTVINDPIQSEDKCFIMNVCVSVPVAKQESIFSFPACIELPQCIGACCEGQQRCHADKTELVTVMVEKWLYKGIDSDGQIIFDPAGQQWVQMEKHNECGCDSCRDKRDCNQYQQLKDCKCQCKDTKTCPKNQFWDAEKCACACQIVSPVPCPFNTIWNRNLCKCVSNFSVPQPRNSASNGIFPRNISALRNLIAGWFRND